MSDVPGGLADELNIPDVPVSPPHAPPPEACGMRLPSPGRTDPEVVYESSEVVPLILPQPPGIPDPAPIPVRLPETEVRRSLGYAAVPTPQPVAPTPTPTSVRSVSNGTPTAGRRKKKDQPPNPRLYQRQPAKAAARSHSSSYTSRPASNITKELGVELNTVNERLMITRQSLEESQLTNSLMVDKLKEAHGRISTLETLREQDRSKWLETVAAWKVHLEQADSKSRKERETLELRMSAYEQSIEHTGALSNATEKAEMRTLMLEREVEELRQVVRVRTQHAQESLAKAEDMERNHTTLAAEYAASVDQCTLLQSIVTSLRTELSKTTLERTAYDERIEALHRDIEGLTYRNTDIAQEMATLKENDALVLQQAGNEYKAEIANLSREMELKVANQKEEARSRYNLYEDEVSSLRHELLTAAHRYETETAKLQADFEERLLKMHNQKQVEKHNDNSAITALRAEISSLEVRCRDTDAYVEAVQAEYDTKLLAKMKEVNSQTAQATALQQEVQRVEYEKQVAVRNTSLLEEQVQRLEVAGREDQSKLHHNERALATSMEREAHLRKQVEDYSVQVGGLQEKLAQAATEAEGLSVQCTQAARKNDYLKNTMQTADNQVKRLAAELERLRQEIVLKDGQLEEVRTKTVQQQVELQQYKIKLVDATLGASAHMPSPSPYRTAHCHTPVPTPMYRSTTSQPHTVGSVPPEREPEVQSDPPAAPAPAASPEAAPPADDEGDEILESSE